MFQKYILVTGSLAFDFIMDFPGSFADSIDPKKIHLLNISFLVDTLKKEKGGTAGNIAYSLGLLKIPVSILATAGDDFADYSKFLVESGVDVKNIRIVKKQVTSQAFIVSDKNDNQISAFHPGAMDAAVNLKISSLPKKPDFVVISPTHPQAMINFAKECQLLKIPYLFDPGMQLPRLTDAQLKIGVRRAKILIGNDYEMSLIEKRLKTTVGSLLQFNEIIITTLGEKGSVIRTKNQEIKISPGKPKKIIDPTGAGDAYRAGFIKGYLLGLDLQTCGQMGSIASCWAVENYGTTNYTFSLAQFCKRYKNNFNQEINL